MWENPQTLELREVVCEGEGVVPDPDSICVEQFRTEVGALHLRTNRHKWCEGESNISWGEGEHAKESCARVGSV